MCHGLPVSTASLHLRAPCATHLSVGQVFETNIRILGGLLSAHLLATYPGYDGSLLRLAKDLGDRLLPAFRTPTGTPTTELRQCVC